MLRDVGQLNINLIKPYKMQKITSSLKVLTFETVFKIVTFTFLIFTGVAIIMEAITNGTPL